LVLVLCSAAWVAADWWFCLPPGLQPQYVGAARCAACHPQQHAAWLGSHHERAMDHATPQTVLGDFDDRRFEYAGITSRLFRQADRFFVTTDGPDGQLATYEVKYTFGVEPLQQYMVEFPRGYVQVLPFCWDTRQRRWFHIYEQEDPPVRAGDPTHWTGPGQNWNRTCAECHSTNLQKHYDLSTDSYRTTYSEINVSCEACHGPGSLHVQLAESRSLFWDRRYGYGLARLEGPDPQPQIDACARCHALRANARSGFHAGHRFLDYYVPERLEPGLYHADGQIDAEVYEYGSFLQSLMFRKGVRCTDCHDPHTLRVRAPGNQLCAKCHVPAKYDHPSHHHHAPGSEGARCVECHMPVKKYMVVDPRRDHSIRPPRPDLSVLLGTPNACTQCHFERQQAASADNPWRDYAHCLQQARQHDDLQAQAILERLDREMAEAVVRWYGPTRRDDPHYALALAAGRDGRLEPGAPQRDDPLAEREEIVQRLIRLARRRDVGPVVRATAVGLLGHYAAPHQAPPRGARAAVGFLERLSTHIHQANEPWVIDDEPLVRLAAVRNLEQFYRLQRDEALRAISRPSEFNPQYVQTVQERADALRRLAVPRLRDPLATVRIEAALVLSSVPTELLDPDERQAFNAALAEFFAGQQDLQDVAPAHVVAARVYENLGQHDRAVAEYEAALRVQSSFIPARVGLATLYHQQGRTGDSERLLREAIAIMPEFAESHFNLGQLLAEDQSRWSEAAAALAEAVRLAPRQARYRYNLGELLRVLDDFAGAEAQLRESHRLNPLDADCLAALIRLYAARQRWSDAEPYAQQLARLEPASTAHVQELIQFYAAQQRYADALPHARRLVELAPDQRAAAAQLQFLLQQTGSGP
jgi:predicted CXXCH cytochrome family protein